MLANRSPSRNGIRFVLTADRVLFGDYATLLDGMTAAAQTTSVPDAVMRHFLSPPVPSDGIRARRAPLGLRLIEAELLREGRDRTEVAVVAPERLIDAVGPATAAVLVSSGDPLGRGMNDSTMSGLGGGLPYNHVWFEWVMHTLAALRSRWPGFRIIAGGPGAWQLEQAPRACRRLGIDVVFSGYAEGAVGRLLDDVEAGRQVPLAVSAAYDPTIPVPTLAGASSMGIVEISRGCGLGCPYCTMSGRRMVHFPVEKILEDLRTNVRGGARNVALASEDFLRYGAHAGRLAPDRVLALAEAARRLDGLGLIQLDHVNVSSVARFPEDTLRETSRVLARSTGQRCLWVNLGVETASGQLLARATGLGKLRPYGPETWAEVSALAVCKLIRCGFVPMVSLMFGMPGETRDDVLATLRFLRSLRGLRMVVFPLFYAPIRPGEHAFGMRDLTRAHWAVLRASYSFNNVWMPRLLWDNQRAGGVSLARRLLLQLGGYLRIAEWQARFLWHSGAML